MLPARVSERRSGLTSRSGKRSLLDDDFFSKLAQEAEKEEEGSDVSDADPMALLESMKDTDDMDADLFGSKKKTNSTAAPTQAKSYGNRDPKIEQKTKSPEIVPPVRPQKRDELTFDDEEDDLMDALGFGESPPKKKGGTSAGQRESNTAQTRLDEILFPGKSALPECPPAQEKDLPEKNAPAKDPVVAEDDFMFGSYQPTLASSQEGRESRRQSVRFSTEDISSPSPERKQSSAATAPPALARPSRAAADWLGLKQEDQEVKTEELLPVKDNPKPRPASPGYSAGSKPPFSGSSSGAKPSETPTNPPKTAANPQQSSVASPAGPAQKGEDDWLAGALTRKKNRVAANPEEKQAGQPEALGFGEEVDIDSFLSKHNSPASRRKSDDTPASSKEPRISQLPQENLRRMATPPHHSDPVKEQRGKEDQPTPAMSSHLPQQTYMENISTAVQSQLTQPGLGGTQSSVEMTALWTQRGDTQHRSRELASQAHLIQLETQMRSLQLERDQAQTLLKTVQRRHTQDMELLEAKHRASVKLLEDALAEKEARRQQESEELMERLATTTRQAEQERLEQQAQYQRRLAQIQQDRDAEVKRLQELQRKSILEVKRDHEEQVQRLKRLKDEEIDAVTSATSQTRSVSVVMEQMDHISRRLGDLSSRMESSQEHSAQELEQGERQRREQLRVLQEHLSQQERSMVEERSRLKEVIAKMEAQLAEQQRQLEKERWRATADQAKAESAQRALEEERRSLTQHITMEREELERAKSALLDEQQSVMQHCSEERRKLAAEWAQFHAQEKQRQEWAERESRRAQERDANREGSIITIAQEQADLRLRAGEVRQREEALSREKEALQRQREEAEQERERLGVAAGRLKTRALELEGFSKLASEKYEEGERALQEARRVEAEHSARLGTVHAQMERLRQQEQHLHQEQMKITDHHREAGGLRQNFPVTALPLSSAPLIPADFASGFGSITAPVPSSGSTEMQAKLALIRNTAQKDRDFLQDEQFFLETLKKAPYNSTLHTA